MRQASYDAMAEIAKVISAKIGSTSTKSSSGIIMSGVTAATDACAAYAINSKLKAFKFSGKFTEWKSSSTWTMGTYELKTGVKIIKGAEDIVGIETMGISAVSIIGTLLKEEVYGAAVDLGATALGVGAMCGTGYIVGGVIAGLSLVGASAAIVTGMGVGVGVAISIGINTIAEKVKDNHYGR